jgi:hypothetical protein
MTKEEQHIAEHIVLEKAGALPNHGHAGHGTAKAKKEKKPSSLDWGAFFFNLMLLGIIALEVWYFIKLLQE